MTEDAEWLTLDEAAALVKVTRRTLYTWMDAGKVTVQYTPSGRRRILRRSLLTARGPGPHTPSDAGSAPGD